MAIKMYSTSWCGDCRRAKQFLAEKGIAYEEIDIEAHPEAAEIVMAHNEGKRRVPTFEIGGQYYGNPPLSVLDEVLQAQSEDAPEDAMDFTDAEHQTVVVIGTGPAGLTAAIYAARANLRPLVYQGVEPGGQLMTTTDVENYPGFPEGVLGPDMMMKFTEQAQRFGADLRYGTVSSVDLSERPFRLVVDEATPILADTVIISTGASAKYLGLENEKRLLGHGVSACATCDGAFFRNQDVAVVGGGDTAMEEALFLTRFATKVYVIHRRDELRASKIMQQRAFANEKIEFIWNTAVEDVLGDKEVTGLVLKNRETDETSTLPVQGFFVAIGHKPNTDLFTNWLDMDDLGYIQTQPDSTYTNIPGVFACGDAQDHVYRQAVTAAGTGCMAAIDAERWLAEQEIPEEAAV